MNHPGSRGQTLVEFAIVVLVFLWVVIGLVDLGRGVFIANSVTNAAREGSRLASVVQDKPLVIQRVVEQTQAATPTVTVAYYNPLTDPLADPATAGPCGSFDGNGHVVSAPSVGCVAVVTTSVAFTPITPIISQFVGTLALGSKSVTRVEFSCPEPSRAGFPFPTADLCPRQP